MGKLQFMVAALCIDSHRFDRDLPYYELDEKPVKDWLPKRKFKQAKCAATPSTVLLGMMNKAGV